MVRGDIEVFLSCSFSSEDAAVNALVSSICTGLRFVCINVGAGFAAIPPEKAKEYIGTSAGLIAIATQRDRLDNGEFIMPSSVREEISIAYGLGKRILILGERGVRFDGFMSNYGTRLPFSRDELADPAFIQKLVFSLYTFRQDVAANLAPSQYATEYISESTRSITSLEYDGSSYLWAIATTKRLRFEAALEREIRTSVWPEVPRSHPPDAPLANWTVTIDSASRPFEVDKAVRFISADRVSLSLRFRPDPQPGDMIEFTRTFKSRFLNPLFRADVPDGAAPAIVIGDRRFFALEGQVVAERTRRLHLHNMFPEEYGLRPEDVKIVVASHSYDTEYLAPWELARVVSSIESFGHRLIVDLRVDDPQPGHIYGLAWDLPA